MVELTWHLDAIHDLDAIGDFIARDSEALARQFSDRIRVAAERLRAHPHLGRVVPEFDSPTLRELIFQNYRIVYRVLPDRVVVIGVVHATMDLSKQFVRRGWDIT